MAKNKGKSKSKKKFKAFGKGSERSASAVAEDAASRIGAPLHAGIAMAKSGLGKAKPGIEKAKSELEEVPAIVEEVRAAAEVAFDRLPNDETLHDLADLFKLFADPTRLRILYALMDGGKCVADISEAAGVSQSATSHQLRGMKQAHLVKSVREGKQVIYSLANDGIQAMLAQGLSCIKE